MICEKPLATSVAEAQELVDTRRRKRTCATAPSTTCASTRWCSTCAACAKTATWARSWWCRAPIRRTGCSTTPIGTGASIQQVQRPLALPGRYRLALVRHGGARHRTAHHLRLRRSADFHKTRKQPKGPIETFAGKTLSPGGLHRDADRYRGLRRGRVPHGRTARAARSPPARCPPGCKNRLNIEIYGTKCGVAWNQERPDELWIGNRNTNNQIIIKDPSLLKPRRQAPTPIFPAATAKATTTRFKQVFRRFYQSIADPTADARVSAVRRRPAPVDYSRSGDGEQREARLGGRSAVPGLSGPSRGS